MTAQKIYEPYTTATAPLNEDGLLEAIVKLDFDEIAATDYEGFLDMLSEAVISDALLLDFSYKAYAVEDGDVLVYVAGYLY